MLQDQQRFLLVSRSQGPFLLGENRRRADVITHRESETEVVAGRGEIGQIAQYPASPLEAKGLHAESVSVTALDADSREDLLVAVEEFEIDIGERIDISWQVRRPLPSTGFSGRLQVAALQPVPGGRERRLVGPIR